MIRDEVATHPLVRLELALGSSAKRNEVLASMALLPQVKFASTEELFELVELRNLSRRGIGITDLHLLASALFDKTLSIWTRDRRPGEVAKELRVRAALSQTPVPYVSILKNGAGFRSKIRVI